MRRLLAREGFDAVTACDGDEGLRLAAELKPSLITLDVFMPGLDGWDVLQRLKADPALREIPVVMLTISDEKSRGFALGAADFLTKPVDRQRLRALLGSYRKGKTRPGIVLIVEDDAPTRQVMQRALASEGWRVIEAENGRVGLEKLRESTPDVILLDLMMPEVDGFEFLTSLRETEAGLNVPVVVVTAAELTPEDHRRLNGGVSRVLGKSAFGQEALHDALAGALAGKSDQEEE
jgi:CheY-like chemotaxis protein